MTPDQLQALAEKEFPHESELISSMNITEAQREGFITGYQRGVEGSAGSWVRADKMEPQIKKGLWLRIVGADDGQYMQVGQWFQDKYGWKIATFNPTQLWDLRKVEILDESTPTTSLRPALEECVKALEISSQFMLGASWKDLPDVLAGITNEEASARVKTALQTAKEALK